MKLVLQPEVHASLLAQAQARGLSLDDYLEQVVRERANVSANRARAGRTSLAQLFAESPLKGVDLTLERDADKPMRAIRLIGEIDDRHQLHADVPKELRPARCE